MHKYECDQRFGDEEGKSIDDRQHNRSRVPLSPMSTPLIKTRLSSFHHSLRPEISDLLSSRYRCFPFLCVIERIEDSLDDMIEG
jgi:hypothetical protein